MSTLYSNILLAFDGSEDSYKALNTAKHLAEQNNAQITVVYVKEDYISTYEQPILSNTTTINPTLYQPNPYGGPVPAPQNEFEPNESLPNDPSHDILSDAMLYLSKEVKNADYEILAGNTAHEICEYAKQKSIDLIVIGSRGLSGIKKLIMGSVSAKVTNHSDCSVLVVK